MNPKYITISFAFFALAFLPLFLTAQDYQLYEGDTVNKRVDGMRQGKWIYFGKDKNNPAYAPDAKVEEGEYANNRKNGLWIKYFPSGKLESEITYKSNRPNGEYKIYYENGQLQEHGIWKNNRNMGHFERNYENGNPQQKFEFASNGKRDGKQEYYYESGAIMIEADIQQGREVGQVKEYHEDGSVKSIKVYDEPGVINTEKSTFAQPPEDPALAQKEPEIEVVDVSVEAKVEEHETQNQAAKKDNPFKGDGEATLYRKDKQISKKGFFKNYKLIEGMWYKYDDNGILIQVMRFKKGRYVGDAPMENDKASSQ
ncbi:MAG: hypothetical protein COA57_00840 [Flavobacteriales bacterium]|nr:MAG: hypothetical protein COA57_00840 [Flavobacteriales bacterium]